MCFGVVYAPNNFNKGLSIYYVILYRRWGVPDLLQDHMGEGGGIQSSLQYSSFDSKMQGLNTFPALNERKYQYKIFSVIISH